MGQIRNIALTACLLLLHLSYLECGMFDNYSSPLRSTRDAKEINDYIYGLNYDRDQVLAYFGESVKGVPTEGSVDGNKNFIVIKREKKSIENGKADIGVLSSNEHRTFPGALLLANSRLLDNQPDFVSIERAPMTYTFNLPGMKEGEGSFSIVPTYANYKAAHDKVLNTWFEKYAPTHDVIAQFQSERTFAYSEQQVRVAFGTDFKYSSVEASIDFSNINQQKKMVMVFKFRQIFYTVSTQAPMKPAEVFAESVPLKDVQNKINKDNPPVLVDSVSYGRTIYVKVETTSTSNEAKVALETKLTGFDVGMHAETEIKNVCENLSMTVYVMGGGSQHIDLINAGTFKEVNDVIIKYRQLTRQNLGYPTTYSTEFIKDNSRAVVKGSTEYTESTRTVYEKGIIELVHNGGYVARYSVSWDEISYDSSGNMQSKRQGWGKNDKDLTAPFSVEIELAGNCQNIAVFARECTGLAWEWWRTVIDRKGISLINHRRFKIWGTTLNPSYSIEPPLLVIDYVAGSGDFANHNGYNYPNKHNLLDSAKDTVSSLFGTAQDAVHGLSSDKYNPQKFYNAASGVLQNARSNGQYPNPQNFYDAAHKVLQNVHSGSNNYNNNNNGYDPNAQGSYNYSRDGFQNGMKNNFPNAQNKYQSGYDQFSVEHAGKYSRDAERMDNKYLKHNYRMVL